MSVSSFWDSLRCGLLSGRVGHRQSGGFANFAAALQTLSRLNGQVVDSLHVNRPVLANYFARVGVFRCLKSVEICVNLRINSLFARLAVLGAVCSFW